MKKNWIVTLLAVGVALLIFRPFSEGHLNKKEQAVYLMMCEVCNNAHEPQNVVLQACAVMPSEAEPDIFEGFLKVKMSGNVRILYVSRSNGRYYVSEVERELRSKVNGFFEDANGIDIKRVQDKIDKVYG